MIIFSELKRVTKLLKPYMGHWAVCGGVAASIYRSTPRFTNDIDIALIDTEELSAKDLATNIIKSLGYKEIFGFIPNPKDPNKQLQGLICCRSEEKETFLGIDFLLPVHFWVLPAVKTAQQNLLDYGFAHLPTITPEDLILAKLAALASSNSRPYDQDDISEIVKSCKIDASYVVRQIKEYEIEVADTLMGIFDIT